MNKMTYYWANGEVVARSYKHFFDRGARFEARDAVTNLHRFCITSHNNCSNASENYRELYNIIKDKIKTNQGGN